MTSNASAFDVIVIGSGIGGLAAASALARRGRRVLVLEQHYSRKRYGKGEFHAGKSPGQSAAPGGSTAG